MILIISCNNDDDSNKKPENDCSTIICSEELRSVYVNIQDMNSNEAVLLDKTVVINLKSGETIISETHNGTLHPGTHFPHEEGTYFIYGDQLKKRACKSRNRDCF